MTMKTKPCYKQKIGDQTNRLNKQVGERLMWMIRSDKLCKVR